MYLPDKKNLKYCYTVICGSSPIREVEIRNILLNVIKSSTLPPVSESTKYIVKSKSRCIYFNFKDNKMDKEIWNQKIINH